MFHLLFGLGPQELIVVAVMILVLFGGRKIPELMKGLGQGIREFNKAKSSIESEVKEGMKELEEGEKKK
ncbi:MAG TPA: twin-arginine translocase TatA/TatE family subunit [Saprospiraceae bacterium]|nr:twin-arginine translocase TatA/TatE family subunit [Saprospiraceae bacterium]